MADTKSVERQVADAQAAQDKAVSDYYKSQENLKPTPTQHENDLAKMGVPVENKEPDGSPPQPQGGAQAEAATRAQAEKANTLPPPAPAPAKK